MRSRLTIDRRYLAQCRLLHPDQSALGKAAATEAFIAASDAFVLLRACIARFDERSARGGGASGDDDDEDDTWRMSVAEELEYREACRQWLGCVFFYKLIYTSK